MFEDWRGPTWVDLQPPWVGAEGRALARINRRNQVARPVSIAPRTHVVSAARAQLSPASRVVRGRRRLRRSRSSAHWPSKSNISNKSLIAGRLSGTYALVVWTGFGRLSRLRAVSDFRPQLRSMNFTTEAWSA